MGTRWRSQFLHSATHSSDFFNSEPPVSSSKNGHRLQPLQLRLQQLLSPFSFERPDIANNPKFAAAITSDIGALATMVDNATFSDRPVIYVHFEFGVSWSRRSTPRSHQLTYMSRSMRDRANQFPRQLPPANTNFLAAPTNTYLPYQEPPYQSYTEETRRYQPYRQDLALHQEQTRDQTYTTPSYGLNPTQQHLNPSQPQHTSYVEPEEQPRRSSRSQSRGPHERGRSAPPPFNDSPWDTEPEPMNSSALPRSGPRSQIWKDLPATPGQFRLGEAGMPWSSTSFPMGYVDDDGSNGEHASPSTRNLSPVAESSRVVEDRDRGRTREMQSLATAMMTVDNGFEDQWWYQGTRLVNVAGQLLSADAVAESFAGNGTVGWAVAEDDGTIHFTREPIQVNTPRSGIVDIVSPISEFPSPLSSYQGLRRSLTTRSDELHM